MSLKDLLIMVSNNIVPMTFMNDTRKHWFPYYIIFYFYYVLFTLDFLLCEKNKK